jgi:hypothetical protein
MSFHKEDWAALAAPAKAFALAHLQILLVAAVVVLAFFAGVIVG